MKPKLHPVTRISILFCFLLITAPRALAAASVYLTVTGAGAQDGSSWNDAYSVARLQHAVTALAGGDTLNLGSGTYPVTTPILIAGSGTAGHPKTIRGVDTGGGLPLLQGDYDVNVPASVAAGSENDICFTFGTGPVAWWQLKDLRLKNYSWAIRLGLSGTTDTLRTHLTFDNLDGDSVEDFIQIHNASQVVIKDCDVIRYCKKAFRYGDYISHLAFVNCTADATGGDDRFPTRAIPAGFQGGDTEGEPRIHDVSFTDCTARNNGYQPQRPYWNGDGFVSEEGTYNISYVRCRSFNNHDGGFDDKADHVTYTDCIAIGNAKGFRYWGNHGTYINCLAAYNRAHGGNNASVGLWVGKIKQPNAPVGVVHIFNSTFHNNGKWALESYEGGRITATDSILSVDGDFAQAGFANNTLVTLADTLEYRPEADPAANPRYVAPSADWTGKPANAFDSTQHGPAKGYHSSRVGRTPEQP